MNEPEIRQIEEGHKVKCPHCGTVIGPTKKGRPACEHVRFIYLNGEDFDYIDPKLEKELEAEEKLTDKQDDVFDMWNALKAHTGPGSMIIEQNEVDDGCGPNTFTVWVGIGPPKPQKLHSAPPKRVAKAKRGHRR
jgi:hypothetical protein